MKYSVKVDILSKLNPITDLSPLALCIIMDQDSQAKSLIEAGAKTYYSGTPR